MGANTVPLTAWEQGGMVVLFALLLSGIIGLLFRWFSGQQKAWQKFIETRDTNWQTFLREQREADNSASAKLATVIDKLVGRVENLENKFDAHDAKEMEFLRSVETRKTQPRK